MARNKGTFDYSANYEVLAKAPLDARLVVTQKTDLINPSIWYDSNNLIWVYTGIPVSVTSDPDPLNNGLYYLIDENFYTNQDYWVKLNMGATIDASGTSALSFQLNNQNNGVMLKDDNGNLAIVQYDSSTWANITLGHMDAQSLKIDHLNGVLYTVDGSVFAEPGTVPLRAFEGTIVGNDVTQSFEVDHNLDSKRQNITVYDNDDNTIYPDLSRGLNRDIISFQEPVPFGIVYTIIILAF